MAEIQPNTKVLEDGQDALLDAEQPEGEIEYANLDELKADDPTKAAPAQQSQSAQQPAKPAAAATPNEDDGLPQEFRGKSKADIIKMYQESHKVIGRQGSELGELRQKVDFAIRASLEGLKGRKEAQDTPAKPAAVEAPDESEFFAKPFDSVSKAIENHPVIREIRETLGRAAAEQATHRAATSTERFNQAHPDAQEILRDPEFRQWVGASRVRSGLLQRAHQHYDYDAGDEVFSTWKALRGAKQASSKGGEQSAQTPDQAAVSAAAATLANARKAKADAAAKAAAVPTSGASGAGKPQGGNGKIYRRTDIVRLMMEDPDRYEALSDEITRAYAEGRVR
jgi:hypothetical protein